MAISLNQVPLGGLEDLVDPKVMGFGTTLEEEVHDLEGYIGLIKAQEEQAKAANLNFKFDRAELHRRYSTDNDIALIVEHIKATVSNDEFNNQFTFRFSMVMEFQGEDWKLIHWHGSIPSDTENDTWHINEWKLENERLEKLVAEQTADLQQKNRELEIESATERIRAHAMGMQSSEDMRQILYLVEEEIKKFDLDHSGTWFWILNENHTLTQWDSSTVNLNAEINLDQFKTFRRHAGHWKSSEYYTMHWQGKELQTLIDEIKVVNPESGNTFQELIDTGQIASYWQACAPFSNGVFGLDYAFEPPEKAETILRKISSALGMAYQRFEDLQKAEKRAKEAQIEAALEKVRSQSLEMQKTSELDDVIIKVNEQLRQLNIDISGGAFIVFNDRVQDDEFYCWGAGGAGDYVQEVQIPFIDRPISYNLWNAIKERKSFFTEMHSNAEKKEFFNHLFKYPPFNQSSQSRKDGLLSIPGGYARSCVVNEHTSIFIINHHGKAFSKEDNRILKQFGRVFEQAYTRFLDLKRSENQALLIREERDRLEIALRELEATKDQLVQQEKLASLGQLTAGIAHEIKNPLNFVNNFSELSAELIQEVREEIESVGAIHELPLQDVYDILDDIEANLKKIHQHGTRADSIVKSMLEHSRGGSGKMEPTDLNSLIKEYVNLSFHGMRAGKDPINVDLQFKLDDSIGEVPLIAEDFSRVIINLCNNGFDAMRSLSAERSAHDKDYKPKLTIRTRQTDSGTTIEIEDNGSGIPEEMKDKIMQPFFTTKKGTEGTGLGLSITNDIVKAHGGSMDVHSKPGQTVFTIKLNG
jgi:signal transduction histidine kinase